MSKLGMIPGMPVTLVLLGTERREWLGLAGCQPRRKRGLRVQGETLPWRNKDEGETGRHLIPSSSIHACIYTPTYTHAHNTTHMHTYRCGAGGLEDISRQAQTKAGHDHRSGTAEGTYRNTIHRGGRERLSHERTRVKVLRRTAEEGRTRKESFMPNTVIE